MAVGELDQAHVRGVHEMSGRQIEYAFNAHSQCAGLFVAQGLRFVLVDLDLSERPPDDWHPGPQARLSRSSFARALSASTL